MKDSDERSLCVRENEILTDLYKCKICSIQVKRDRMDIEAHLKQGHRLNLKTYSANFENPNVKDEPEEMIEKLVRKGILMEPTKSCNTPKKIKIKPDEFKETKMNSAAVAPLPAVKEKAVSHMKVKAEVYDASYLNQTNYTKPLFSYDTDSDTESWVSTKRKRMSASNPCKALKISQVMSLAKDEDNNSQEVRTEEEAAGTGIYCKCPSTFLCNCLAARRRTAVQVSAVPL